MPLNLTPECKYRLLDILEKGLPHVRVENGKFIDRMSIVTNMTTIDDVLPKKGPAFETLLTCFNDYPATDFVDRALDMELNLNSAFDADKPFVSLTTLKGYSDPLATARRLVEAFDTLPWDYMFSIELPEKLFNRVQPLLPISLGNAASIQQCDDSFETTYPLIEKLDKKTLLGHEPKWSAGKPYLQIRESGYIGPYGGGPAVRRAEDVLRTFFGLALALTILEINRQYSDSSPTKDFRVHRHIDGKHTQVTKLPINSNYAAVINDLAPDGVTDAYDEAFQTRFALTNLPKIQKVFSAGAKAEQIALAARWHFDAYQRGDELLAFVRAMIVLEILLGDKASSDEVGLGLLLRDRCAYLIAESHAQRKQISEEFKKIYDVRSQIVHRGKSRLTAIERTLFNRLMWMGRRVIQEEIRLLDGK